MTTPMNNPTNAPAQQPMNAAAPPRPERGPGAMRRIMELGLLELRLMMRNRTTVFNVLMMAPIMVLLLTSFVKPPDFGRDVYAGTLVTSLVSFALIFIAYYSLVATAVARREELMLKRLSTGEVTRGEILIAMSVPALVFMLVQGILGFAAVSVLIAVPPVPNALLAVLGLILGFAVFTLLAYASTAFTRTVESAQITTLPVMIVAMFPSGLFFPLDGVPEMARTIAELTPLAPVVSLLNLGLTGLTKGGELLSAGQTWGAALLPLGVLIAWILVGTVLVRKVMRWEPRR